MKKLLFIAIAFCCLILMFACANDNVSSISQPDPSENSFASEDTTASDATDASAGELEKDGAEELLPSIFYTTPDQPKEISLSAEYEYIHDLIESGEYEQAYVILKAKTYDIYAEKLLERFTPYYKESKNNYVWYESGVMWDVQSYSVNENGWPIQKTYHMSFSPTVSNPNVKEYVYNQDGLLIEHENKEFTYDENGRLIEIVNTYNDKIDVKKLYWYENGLLAKEEFYRSAHKDAAPDNVTEYFYNENGRIIRENIYQGGVFLSVVEYEHNDNGQKAVETTTFRNGNTEVVKYFYNGISQKIAGIETTTRQGSVITERFVYDNNGNLSTHTKTGEDNYIFFRYQYVYDENGHITLSTSANREHLALEYETTLYTTDANGNVIKQESRGYNSHSGLTHIITTCGYDNNGNLVWQNVIHPENEKVWSKQTYDGYTILYDEFAAYRLGLIV